MWRLRDIALVAAVVAVGAAALVGPLLGRSAAPALGGPVGIRSPGDTTGPSAGAVPSPSALLGTLAIAATNVHTATTPDGRIVLSIRLTARLRSSRVVMLRTDPTGPALRFTIVAPQSVAVVGTLHAAAPPTLPAGSAVPIDLTFDLRGLSLVPRPGVDVAAGGPPAPGTWLLTVDLVDVSGVRQHAETPVMVVPTG